MNIFQYARISILGKVKFLADIFFKMYSKTSSALNVNPFEIPIIIISYNQLNFLERLISFLEESGYQRIVVVDNNSTYPPLLEYLKRISHKHQVHFLNENHGHMVFWKLPELYRKYGKSYYAVTDADILPLEDCPKDFMHVFKSILDRHGRVNKVGFSLYLDDIPDTNSKKEQILEWETKYWSKPIEGGHYLAHIDTTFALYRPLRFSVKLFFYSGIRTKSPYLARHGGWYIDENNLTEEQQFYINTASSSSSWLSLQKNSPS